MFAKFASVTFQKLLSNMACESCTSTPVRGKTSLPSSNAYLKTNSSVTMTSAVKTVKEYTPDCSGTTAYTCGQHPGTTEAPCVPALSTSSYSVPFIPGWVLKLTGAAKGKLLIAVDKALHFFKGAHSGPLYYEDGNVTVDHPQELTHKGGDGAFIENGLIPLARKDKEFVEEGGTIVEKEVYRHGVQQLREVAVGEMAGFTQDCFNDTVRHDVIQPNEHDMIKQGWITGFRRLGYRIKEIQNGCAVQKVKEWFHYNGAVFGPGEVKEASTLGLPAHLIPVETGEGVSYVLSTPKFVDSDGVPSTDASGYRIPVLKPVYGDKTCPSKLTGFITEYLTFPTILASDNAGKAISFHVPETSGAFEVEAGSGQEIDLTDYVAVPENASAVQLMISITPNGSANTGVTVRHANGTTAFSCNNPTFDQYKQNCGIASISEDKKVTIDMTGDCDVDVNISAFLVNT